MKILVFNWRDIKNPESGGAEVHIHEILKRLSRKGHKITLIASYFKCANRKEFIDSIHIKRVGNKYLFNIFAIFHYFKIKKYEKFDVVIDDISKIPLYTPLYVKKPKIAIVHHMFEKTALYEANFIIALMIKIALSLMVHIYKKVPIIVVSESTKSDLINRGIPRNNIYVIHNGIDLKKYSLGVKSEEPLIVYFGRVKRYKRIDHLIKAFYKIRKDMPNLKLIIAGKGDYKLFKDLKNDPNIELIGEVSEEEKIKILQKAWIFVNPSLEEGWGITVIEANACGTPAVGYNVPGLKDSIKHEYNGLLVEDGNIEALAEALKNIILDDSLRAKLSRNAIEWAKRFSWDRSAEEFEKIIKMVVDENG